MSENERHMVLSATFTSDHVSRIVEFWASFLNQEVVPVMAPIAQVYQQLLEPGSDLRTNQSGFNVLLVRWKDLAVALPQAYARAARELTDAVSSFAQKVPLLVVLCPEADREEVVEEANRIFTSAVSGVSGVQVLDATEALTLYAVSDVFDPEAEKTAQIPYTNEAMAAIGTMIYRRWALSSRKPVKMLAVDCDNTLWDGVVGEDGVTGVSISDGHKYLQEQLVRQGQNGRVVSLLSKNDERDVRRVLDERTDMILSADDIVSTRINWKPKPANLLEITAELNLGSDSVVFLDDSMVECAEMRASCPDVATVLIPKESDDLRAFVDHLWLFDHADATAEDTSRVQMYKEQAIREASRQSAVSLESFFDTLELDVSIASPDQDQLDRFSQLTQRTNQFNASLSRLSIADLQHASGNDSAQLRIVSAKDRFGDYGVVGAMRAMPRDGELVADVFLLSCRALGRGIEHRMIAALGEIAAVGGIETVSVVFEEGPRNQPVRQFLQGLKAAPADLASRETVSLPADKARALRFDPSAGPTSGMPGNLQPVNTSAVGPRDNSDSGLAYQRIATEFTTARAILCAIEGAVRERPELMTEFVTPSSVIEKQIARVWEQILRLDRVGINDGFFELGGKSIQLVQIHSLLQKKLSVPIEFTSLFEHRTISSLAKSLSARQQNSSAFSASGRAQRMRQARDRRAAKFRQRQEMLS